jgi:hypothetical protein
MSYQSTIPGAITQLYSYAQTVAASASFDTGAVGAFIGWPTGADVPANWLMVGDYSADGGNVVQGVRSDLNALMPMGNYIREDYKINCSIVCWSGDANPTDLLSNAFALYSAFVQLLTQDPNGSGALGGSGTWGSVSATVPITGPVSDSNGGTLGWGVVIEFAVAPNPQSILCPLY